VCTISGRTGTNDACIPPTTQPGKHFPRSLLGLGLTDALRCGHRPRSGQYNLLGLSGRRLAERTTACRIDSLLAVAPSQRTADRCRVESSTSAPGKAFRPRAGRADLDFETDLTIEVVGTAASAPLPTLRLLGHTTVRGDPAPSARSHASAHRRWIVRRTHFAMALL